MRQILRRFSVLLTLVFVLTFFVFGAFRVTERAAVIMDGEQPSVITVRRTEGAFGFSLGTGTFPLSQVSLPQWAVWLLYATPLGSVLGVWTSIRALHNDPGSS